jgi:hypothetical protein
MNERLKDPGNRFTTRRKYVVRIEESYRRLFHNAYVLQTYTMSIREENEPSPHEKQSQVS